MPVVIEFGSDLSNFTQTPPPTEFGSDFHFFGFGVN